MAISNEYTEEELKRMLIGKKKQQEEAFTQIYNQYSQRIYAYCLRIVGSKEDANDLFQETFFKFFEVVKKSSDFKNINGFLIRIARNLCLNFKRVNNNFFKVEDFEFITPSSNYENQELLELISKALELLDFEYREAFILRQYQGLPYAEIGDIIGMKESSAKNRCWRAKEKIKEILQPYMKDIENNQG
ncbi:RNA polymerase sigma factor [Candidatus Kapabacteria bacterium]|nr:RNA polymerase sigma factor [Candidatus Kapabacteria bacterium]